MIEDETVFVRLSMLCARKGKGTKNTQDSYFLRNFGFFSVLNHITTLCQRKITHVVAPKMYTYEINHNNKI